MQHTLQGNRQVEKYQTRAAKYDVTVNTMVYFPGYKQWKSMLQTHLGQIFWSTTEQITFLYWHEGLHRP